FQRFGSAYRLKSADVAQGFIPGEAAAFVAVTTPNRVGGRRTCGVVRGLGLAREDQAVTALGDGHPTGQGLAQAPRAPMADGRVRDLDVAFRASDLNGETYRGQESMFVLNRAYPTLRPTRPVLLPAACVGETGAAAGALVLIVAATAMARGYAPGRLAMCEA